MRAIIVGSGMAGLTAAAYLVRAGALVEVYEQFPEPGGVTASVERGGYRWDLGPLVLEGFGEGEPAGDVLADLGLAGAIRLVPGERAVCFPDFRLERPEPYPGPRWRQERLAALFPDDAAGLERLHRLYVHVRRALGLHHRLERAAGAQAWLLRLKLLAATAPLLRYRRTSAEALLGRLFASEQLRAVFSGILADFTVPPSRFPGLWVPALNPESVLDHRIPLALGRDAAHPSFGYIAGGTGRLVGAFVEAIEQAGGRIHTGVAVSGIELERGAVSAVKLANGERREADHVLVSGGARELRRLLDGQTYPGRLARELGEVPLMESVLMVHLGVDLDPRPHQRLPLTYYYGTYDIEGGVRRCREGRYHEGRDGFLIYVPSLHSPELAPGGRHAVTVYTIAPDRLAEGTWAERRDELADKLVAAAERYVPGLGERTEVRWVLTPEDFRARTHQREHHSFGGAAPMLGRSAASHRTGVSGLWFLGAQSESFGGVANVMAGGRRVARMVLAGTATP